VSKNSRQYWIVLLGERSPPQILDALASPMVLLSRISDAVCHWQFFTLRRYDDDDLFVDGPTTAGTGVAKCVMRYDGTDPLCGLDCTAPYVFSQSLFQVGD
jgi:hypothetical protein